MQTTTSPGHLSASGIAQITTEGRVLQAQNARISLDRLVGQPGTASARLREALANHQVHGAYLHVPFCFHKCHYCDFYSIVDSPANDRRDAFVERLILEIRAVTAWWRNGSREGTDLQRLQTIFVGGGTPTLLTPPQWERLLRAMQEYLPLERDGEFTIEANPETVTPELAEILAAGGVNRVSIGAQSFNPHHLKTLERWHDPRNVEHSVQIMRGAGVTNINLDLIFGVPGQTLDEWLSDLDTALALGPSHISCYGLMYEPNTALTARLKAGAITRVDEDVEAAMYEATIDRLGAAGFEQYEISNFARLAAGLAPRCGTSGVGHRTMVSASPAHASAGQAPPLNNVTPLNDDSRCRHNLLYWRNASWWAFGPSASGHINGVRWKNVPRLGDYLDDADGTAWPAITDVEIVDDATAAGEQFMLGLRLIEGVSQADAERLLALSGSREQARRAALERHRASGLIEVVEDRLRLTRRGLLLANDVLVDLV